MSNKTARNQRRRTDTRFLVQLSLLLAIQIILVATPLGYMPLGPIDITLVHVPVLIAAITMGPMAGGILGGVFGLSSMIVATMRGGLSSLFFSPFVSHSVWSIVIAMIPRILLGIMAAWMFRLFAQRKMNTRLAAGISAGASTLIHSILVMAGIFLFFGPEYAELLQVPESGLLVAVAIITTQNGLVEAAIAIVICAALAPALMIASQKRP